MDSESPHLTDCIHTDGWTVPSGPQVEVVGVDARAPACALDLVAPASNSPSILLSSAIRPALPKTLAQHMFLVPVSLILYGGFSMN